MSHKGFRVWADAPLDASITAVLDDAETRLARSPLYDAAMVHRLYLCNSPRRMMVLAPKGYGAFAVTYPLRRNTVLNRTDVRANVVYNHAARHNRQSLAAVIAHERTHALMMDRYGVAGNWRLPTWKKEGYCEYVGGESAFDRAEGKRLVADGREENSGAFRYFRYHLMVKYLLEVEGLTVDEVMARDLGESTVLAGVRKNLDRL